MFHVLSEHWTLRIQCDNILVMLCTGIKSWLQWPLIKLTHGFCTPLWQNPWLPQLWMLRKGLCHKVALILPLNTPPLRWSVMGSQGTVRCNHPQTQQMPNSMQMLQIPHSLPWKTSTTSKKIHYMILCLLFVSRGSAHFVFLEVNQSSAPPSMSSCLCQCIYQLTHHIRAHVIVCLDANFAQWRCHSHHPNLIDPHPDTHFLSEQAINMMKQLVDHAWPLKSHSTNEQPQLPDETLDNCKWMFVAAQSHIMKTSSTIFADTTLMALLCHHDHPLFLVNMTSAGEQQYYPLALIKALFLHLPSDWIVALLYDIACQLECSMRKVGLPLKPVISELNWQ